MTEVFVKLRALTLNPSDFIQADKKSCPKEEANPGY